MFTSDNGPAGGAGGSAAPLRGGKFTTWEGGHRVPMVMWGPGIVASGRTCDAIVMAMDFLPTIASLVGAEVPTDRVIDGRNILPLVQGDGAAKPPHDTFYYYRANGAEIEGIRMGDWKYLRNKDRKAGDTEPVPRLFNLADDIGETTNLIDRHPEKAEQLKQTMRAFDVTLENTANTGPSRAE